MVGQFTLMVSSYRSTAYFMSLTLLINVFCIGHILYNGKVSRGVIYNGHRAVSSL